jgi:dihydrofolate reductase
MDELMATGAVVSGRGTFEGAGGWGGDHHDGVPIWVVRRGEPAPEYRFPLVTYTDDVREAFASAKAAAGDRDVLVHGMTLARLAIEAGVLDEIELSVVPVLLGDGVRLFEGIGATQRELRRVRVLEGDEGMVHLRYALP